MNAKVSTKAIRLTILVIVILTPVCLPSSSLQSYRIISLESTMTAYDYDKALLLYIFSQDSAIYLTIF